MAIERQGPGKIIGTRGYTGKVISIDIDTVRFPDGSTGQLEMVRHPGASAIVPLLGDLDNDPEVLLIRQYRYAAEGYLLSLIRKGFRVAIAEQLEDPAEAKKRGYKAVVRRDVVRLVTPGTLTEESLLEARRHNFLAAFAGSADKMLIEFRFANPKRPHTFLQLFMFFRRDHVCILLNPAVFSQLI